ncbi:hypothetical protein [Arthrobacter sp. CP30]
MARIINTSSSRGISVTTGRSSWFIVAALCVVVAVLIFAGRTVLADVVGDPVYRGLIIAGYIFLGAAAGSLTKAFSIDRHAARDSDRLPAAKVHGGATYTLIMRPRPDAGERAHYWLGDNGDTIELTDEEAARLP